RRRHLLRCPHRAPGPERTGSGFRGGSRSVANPRQAMAGIVVDRGLEGVNVGETVLSNVEGEVGRLTFRGYDIDDLGPKATYEEVVALMLQGKLPTQDELAALDATLASKRALPAETLAVLRATPRGAWPMDVLRTAVS